MEDDSVQLIRGSPLINYFDTSATGFAWRPPRPQQIEARRAAMGDLLIFDILLSSGSIRDGDLLYPPTDPPSLQRLLDAIGGSHYDALKKNCLVYFLLKWHQDGREDKFRRACCIPPQFTMLADAYWHLDSGVNVPRAVTLLSDARLNRDYASKILQAISLTPDPAPLIRRYVRTAKPPLTEPNDLDTYTLALAESSLLEAWQFQKTFNETDFMRPRLFKKLLEWVVTPEPRPASLTMLISLPLSPFEENLLHSYAQDPPPSITSSDAAILQDLVCVRLIQAGRHSEAIKLDRQFSFSSATGQNLKATQDRKKMVQDLYAALTSVERAQLDAELNLRPAEKPKPAAAPKPTNGSASVAPDVTMSQSWEEIRAPDALNQSTSSQRDIRAPELNGSISKQSGAPRFGGPVSKNNSRLPLPVTAAPLLPISSTTISNAPSGSTSVLTPRRSLGFPTTTPLTSSLLGGTPSSSTSKQPRHSLSGVGSRMLNNFGGTGVGISSPASGLKFPPLGSSTKGTGVPAPINFTPSGSQQNAFYQPPPPAKTNGVKRPFDGLSASPERPNPLVSMERLDENEVMDVDENGEKEHHVNGTGNGHATRNQGEDENVALEYSVFGNTRPTITTAAPQRPAAFQNHQNELSASASQRKRLPPGAFLDDDDAHEDEDDERPQQEQEEEQPQNNQKRKSARTSKREAPAKPARKPTRQTKKQEPGGTFPGALTDHEEEEEEEELQDHVAPLPGPTVSAEKARRPTRKARSSASMSDLGEGESADGMKTRRRSSRLTTTGSVGDEPPAKTRKGSSRSGASKKKRS